MVEAVFFREGGVFVGRHGIFQWKGNLSVGLTRTQGTRGFEGDPAGANPGVGGHEHQRVPLFGESLRPKVLRDRAGVSGGPAQGGDVGATIETQFPVEDRLAKTVGRSLRPVDDTDASTSR